MLTDFKLPDLGENIKSGLVTKVMIKPGDIIKKDQPVLELETDKAVLEVPCSLTGTVKEILIKAGQEVKVGQLIMKVDTSDVTQAPSVEKPRAKEEPKTKEEPPVSALPSRGEPSPKPSLEPHREIAREVPAAPSVRRFAREIGIDLTQVPGTGPGGRISLDDVKAYAKQINTTRVSLAQPAVAAIRALPDFSKWGAIERQPLNMLRRKTAEHLSYAWSAIPHVTQFDKADITELEKLRKKYEKKTEASGGKLTITAFVLKVLASALKVFPQFNATIDLARNEVVYKKHYHIGVAVDTERGLLVPVIRDVDKKNILEIALALTEISQRARDKKTSLEEMQGGTFTLTNLGGIGGVGFTPIVNWPEVAILGVARASPEPVLTNDEFVPRLTLPLSLSYDHRLVDGADGARFLRWVCEAIQQPFLMELERT